MLKVISRSTWICRAVFNDAVEIQPLAFAALMASLVLFVMAVSFKSGGATESYRPDIPKSAAYPVHPSRAPLGRVAESRQPVHVVDVREDRAYLTPSAAVGVEIDGRAHCLAYQCSRGETIGPSVL